MSNKIFWEKISDKFDTKFDRYTDFFGFDYVIQLLGDIENKNILDYGCGEGQLTSLLANKKANTTGTDISKNALISAREKFNNIKNLNFTELDDKKLFIEDHYDFCISTFVFTCMESSSYIKDIIKKISISLKTNGKFIILLPNPDSIGKQFYSFRCDAIGKIKDGSKVEYTLKGLNEKFQDFWWSDDFFIKLFKENKFNKITVHKPLPEFDEKWIDEKKYPPFVIYECEK